MTLLRTDAAITARPKSKPGITTTIEWVGPKQAAVWLALNTHNRTLVQGRINTFARDMVAGDWLLNGETIKISETNVLLDGQHRLKAVIESKATVQMMVVRGLPDATQSTVDLGAKRSFGDILSLAGGETSTHNLASSVRLGWFMDVFGRPRTTSVYPSPAELQAWLDENPGIRDSVTIGNRASKTVLRYAPSVATVLHYKMGDIDADARDTFWTQLLDGTAPKDSPIYALREALLRDLGKPHRMSVEHRMALTIRAWNAMREGRAIQIVLWRPGREPFPTLK